MASRDPPRRGLRARPRLNHCEFPYEIPLALISAYQYTAQCSASQGPDALRAASRSGRLASRTSRHRPCGRQCQCASFRSNGRLGRRGPRGLRQETAPRRPGPAGPHRHCRARRGRRNRVADGPGSRQGPGQPRLSPRRTHDQAAASMSAMCSRLARSSPELDPQNQQNALRTAQANLASAEAALTAGPPDLRPAAAASGGRLDAAREIRRGPAGAC